MWQPTEVQINNSQMMDYMQLVNQKFGLSLKKYSQLYDWSIEKAEDFWESFWEYSQIIHHSPYSQVVDDLGKMPGAKWFDGATLNFAENLLRYRDDKIAILFQGEDGTQSSLTYKELHDQVSGLAHSMREMGIVKKDRVAGFMPNIPEAIITMLATASIGAIWSSCSPDFGIKGVLDRFQQIEPKLIFATDGYLYNGKTIDCLSKLKKILVDLPSIKKTIIVPFAGDSNRNVIKNSMLWDDFLHKEFDDIIFEQLPFDHHLYIMYSSGTTGLPKSIVHSAGGTLIQHSKEHQLHTDLTRNDTTFYFTTCGWMMWNWLVSSLASGATLMLYDGSQFINDNDNILFDFAEQEKFNFMGVSAKYLDTARNKELFPRETHNLESLKMILSTGSALSVDCFDYVYQKIKPKVCLSSISGGTDIVSCFVLGSPMLPVYRGELQTRGLGLSVEVWNDKGESVIDQKGELVCIKTFPSKPTGFWNDDDGNKYRQSYFDRYPNVWCHGDFVSLNLNGGMVFYGRSDTTLNRGGVRIGTAEIYRQVEKLEEVIESVVVEQNWQDDMRIILFVKLRDSLQLDDPLKGKICTQIRSNTSPRHVPDVIIQVSDIPRTKSGKIVELAVQKAIHNLPIDNKTALDNPEVLQEYYQLCSGPNSLL